MDTKLIKTHEILNLICADHSTAYSTRMVLFVLAKRVNPPRNGNYSAWVKVKTIAGDCNIRKEAVYASLRELEAAGLLRIDRRSHAPSYYHINVPLLQEQVAAEKAAHSSNPMPTDTGQLHVPAEPFELPDAPSPKKTRTSTPVAAVEAMELEDTEEELSSVAASLQVLKIVGEKLSPKDIASLSKGLAKEHSEDENLAAIASLGPTTLAEASKSRNLPAYLRACIRNAVAKERALDAEFGPPRAKNAESDNAADLVGAEPKRPEPPMKSAPSAVEKPTLSPHQGSNRETPSAAPRSRTRRPMLTFDEPATTEHREPDPETDPYEPSSPGESLASYYPEPVRAGSALTPIKASPAEPRVPRKLSPEVAKLYASFGGVAQAKVPVLIPESEPESKREYEYEPETRPERQYTDREMDDFLALVVAQGTGDLEFIKDDDSPFTRSAVSTLKRRAEASEANFEISTLKKIDEGQWRVSVRHAFSSYKSSTDQRKFDSLYSEDEMATILGSVTAEESGKLIFRRGCRVEEIRATKKQFNRLSMKKHYLDEWVTQDDGSKTREVKLGSPAGPIRDPYDNEIYADDI